MTPLLILRELSLIATAMGFAALLGVTVRKRSTFLVNLGWIVYMFHALVYDAALVWFTLNKMNPEPVLYWVASLRLHATITIVTYSVYYYGFKRRLEYHGALPSDNTNTDA